MHEVIETRDAKIWMRPDGVLEIKHLNMGVHTLDDAMATLKAQLIAQNGRKTPALVDISEVGQVSSDARSFYASLKNISAAALIVESPASKLIGNMVLVINRPNFPLKLFGDSDKALEWAKQFLSSALDNQEAREAGG